MNKFEEELKNTLEIYSNNSLPSENIKTNVFKSLDNNKTVTIYQKPIFKAGLALSASFALVLSFFLALNFSSDFSRSMSSIPVISNIASAFTPTQEPQLMMAMEVAPKESTENADARSFSTSSEIKTKESTPKIAMSKAVIIPQVSDKEITFTVENIAVDSERLLLTYSVKDENINHKNAQKLYFKNMILGGEGKKLLEFKNGKLATKNPDFTAINLLNTGELGANNVYVPEASRLDRNKLFGRIEIIKKDKKASFPSNLNISVDGFKSITGNKENTVSGNWNLNFSVPTAQNKAEPVTYGSKSAQLQAKGINLALKVYNTKVSPTVTTVEMKLESVGTAPNSIGFKYHLEDEKGNAYRTLEDIAEKAIGKFTGVFETCYYTFPQELYLVIESTENNTKQTDKSTFAPVINKKVRLF